MFSGINKILVRSGRVFTRFRIPVLIFLLSGGIWLSMGINELKVDTNPDHYFPSDSRLRVANTKISDAFGGSTQWFAVVLVDQHPVLVDQRKGLVDQHKVFVDQHQWFGGSTLGFC